MPRGINESLEFLKSTDPKLVLSFWAIQLERLLRLVEDCSTTQLEWSELVPDQIKGAQATFKSAASHQLLKNFPLGAINGFPNLFLGSQRRGAFLRTEFFLSRINLRPQHLYR